MYASVAEREPPCALCSSWLLDVFDALGHVEDWLTARRPRAPFKKDDDLKHEWGSAPGAGLTTAYDPLEGSSVSLQGSGQAASSSQTLSPQHRERCPAGSSPYASVVQCSTAAHACVDASQSPLAQSSGGAALLMSRAPGAAGEPLGQRSSACGATAPKETLGVARLVPNLATDNAKAAHSARQLCPSSSMPTERATPEASPTAAQAGFPARHLSLFVPQQDAAVRLDPVMQPEATPDDAARRQVWQGAAAQRKGETGEPASPSPPVLEIPYDSLVLGQVIGEGGFAKVHRASWNGTCVAVKVMSTDISKRGDVIHEFRREVETMSSMKADPHVLRLLAACTHGNPLALVTEYCARGSLYGMLHSPHVHLSWRQIYYMCLGAARGMRHLHSQNILHRDLKSGNLLVDENLSVKVADFGLSKVTKDFQTLTGGLGTYQWMAPEVLANSRYSEKADVYSFGIVLWECTARQVPYAGTLGMPAAIAVMNRGLRPDIPKYAPAPLADLMRSCWAALPKDRPSFGAIVKELEQLYRNAGVV